MVVWGWSIEVEVMDFVYPILILLLLLSLISARSERGIDWFWGAEWMKGGMHEGVTVV
jgi:hypothetical protein